MNEKIENMKKKAKEKVVEVKEKAYKGAKFLAENSWMVMPILSGLGTIAITAMGVTKDKKNRYDQACLVKDDISGLKFKTTHPLTNHEIMELSERMNDGQTKGEALNEMELLKKEKKRK